MQKYLQLTTTSVVICFTYFIGIFVIIITNQVDFTNVKIHRLFMMVTIFVLGYTSILFFSGFIKIKRISKAIRDMMDEVK